MGGDLSQRLAPDDLWAMVEPVLPSFRSRPQGGGTAPIDQRAVFTAVMYVLTSGCAWRYLPPSFGVSPATAHRRFSVWTASGVWRRLHRVVLDEIGARGGLDWSSVIVDAASVRAKKGDLTGPNPVDRGKYGSKIHLITERTGLPISVGISAANLHDSQALIPLVKGIPLIRSRRGPRRRKPGKLHGDKGYNYSHLRRWLRERGITHRIARRGVESSQRLGRHRWTIERTMAWLAGCRRLHRRYERKADHFLAFTTIACVRVCYRRLAC
ncbi:IS5 family transposase [Streptomyces zaomyceticus]|uniref:IS5 family transposase n=1 Tax=Streptomyces zaomyceticus TaxID=68286 RepID=UPI002F91AA8E